MATVLRFVNSHRSITVPTDQETVTVQLIKATEKTRSLRIFKLLLLLSSYPVCTPTLCPLFPTYSRLQIHCDRDQVEAVFEDELLLLLLLLLVSQTWSQAFSAFGIIIHTEIVFGMFYGRSWSH